MVLKYDHVGKYTEILILQLKGTKRKNEKNTRFIIFFTSTTSNTGP